MAQLKTKRELATEAETLAVSYSYVQHSNVIYIPTDYETGDDSVTPAPERTIWIPMSREDIRIKAFTLFNTLFENEAQLANFHYMVGQCATEYTDRVDSLLIRTSTGLKELRPDGTLADPSGRFVPNTLKPVLNEDRHDRLHLFEVLVNWLDSEEAAVSLLRHLATALAPHWSAVKYLLFLGAGRNGKSLLMHMLMGVFGRENCSHITRQDIADNSPVVTELNGKLLNIVFDGMAVYLKDSGREKSLIAGESVGVRRLYSSVPTEVQTNGLFIEGLNQEPKSSDKSTALQSRIVRFGFPNVYDDDRGFWNEMISERNLGALLNLMIEHYVIEEEATKMLAPTAESISLQMEHMVLNSKPLQFIKFLEDTDPLGADSLIDMDFTELVIKFNDWKLKELNDISSWPEPDVLVAFRPVLLTERRSKRISGTPRKIRQVVAFTKETRQYLNTIKEDAHEDTTTVVDD